MKVLVLFILLSCAAPMKEMSPADKQAHDAVKKTVTTMFDAMRENDADKLKSVFAENVDSYTIFVNSKTNKPVKNKGDVAKFIEAVGQPKAQNEWDEKIYSWDINVDGNLATAWTDYSFYHKGKRSHCGVNTFMLFNDGDAWKIYAISDTRRRSNCHEDKEK